MGPRNVLLVVLLYCFACGPYSAKTQATTGKSRAESVAQAEKSDAAWLALVDTGQYDESWKTAAPAFQAAVGEQKWQDTLKAVRDPLGKLDSRQPVSSRYTTSLPGAPDGEYVVCTFASSFEHKARAQETVVAQHEPDGSWRITGYFIK